MRLQKIRRLFTKARAILAVLSPILFSVIITVAVAYTATFLTIGKVECKTEYGPCSKTLAGAFAPIIGKSLLLTGRDEVSKLSEGQAEIQSLNIRKKLPDTLVVDVAVRKARAAIVANGKLLLVDLEGKVIAETDKSTLPKVNLNKDLSEVSIEETQWIVGTLSSLYALGISSKGELRGRELVLQVSMVGDEDNLRIVEVVVGKVKDPALTAGSLQFMLNQFKMNGKLPVAIDLRFKNPVVVFNN